MYSIAISPIRHGLSYEPTTVTKTTPILSKKSSKFVKPKTENTLRIRTDVIESVQLSRSFIDHAHRYVIENVTRVILSFFHNVNVDFTKSRSLITNLRSVLSQKRYLGQYFDNYIYKNDCFGRNQKQK